MRARAMTITASRRHFLMGNAVAASMAWLPASRAAAQPSSGDAARGQSAPPGDRVAPALPALGSVPVLPTVSLFDGTEFSPAQAAGKVLVIYWWASWCPFCAQQSPHMEALWRAQRGRGLRMLALSIDRTPEPAIAYLQKKGYTFPAGLLTPQVAKALPKPKGLPVTVVLGRDGKVAMAEAGQLFPEDVEEIARFL
jgi:thiol-disulfide isomerase/thioredoxin